MKILITGGAGFIGSHIAKVLISRGDEVTILDNLSTGFKSNLSEIEEKIRFVEGDITNLPLLKKTFEGIDYVLHQAALGSVPRSIADPITSNENNISGTLNVLVAARDAKVKRVVYAGSSSAYGDVKVDEKEESLPPAPKSPYAITKYVGELYCQNFYKLYGLETIVLRYFNVFGPFQNPSSQYSAVIPRFIQAMLKGQTPIIYGDGEQSRDFTFVANNVAANIAVMTSPKGVGEVINIACGGSHSLNTIINIINKELKTDITPVYEAERLGDVRDSKASIKKASELLNWKPTVTFEEGLKETIQWYRKNLEINK